MPAGANAMNWVKKLGDRASLRHFLSDPQRAMPGKLMSTGMPDPIELEKLLDYLETLR